MHLRTTAMANETKDLSNIGSPRVALKQAGRNIF